MISPFLYHLNNVMEHLGYLFLMVPKKWKQAAVPISLLQACYSHYSQYKSVGTAFRLPSQLESSECLAISISMQVGKGGIH